MSKRHHDIATRASAAWFRFRAKHERDQTTPDGAAAKRRRQIEKVASINAQRRTARFDAIKQRKRTAWDIETIISEEFPDADSDEVENFAQQLEVRYRPEIPTEKQIIDDFKAKPVEKKTSHYGEWHSDPSGMHTLEKHEKLRNGGHDYTWNATMASRPTEWWIKLRSKSNAVPQAIRDFLREIRDGGVIMEVVGMAIPGLEHTQHFQVKGHCIMIRGRVQADAQTVKKILEKYNFGDDWKVRVGGLAR